jgi:hypothetical protein
MSRWDDTSRHFDDALAMNEEMGARPWVAYTQNDYAQILLARNGPDDREPARDLIDPARAAFRELGMKTI